MGQGDQADEIAALRRENAILRETLDAIDGTVVVYDPDRLFVLANRAYHTFFPHLPPDTDLRGLRYEDVLGLSLRAGTVVDPRAKGDPSAFTAARIREFNAPDAPPREVRDPRTNRWYMIRVQRTPAGNRVALRVEITDQKRMQEDLRVAQEAAEQASRAKSQFLAAVSHDLRTPLNAVINFAHLMVEEIHGPTGAPEYAEYARTILQSGADLLAQIDDVLEFARADAGQMDLNRQWVNVRALIQSLTRNLAPDATKVGVRLEAELPPVLPPILGDRPRLWRALSTLIGNAITLTRDGGTARMSAYPTDDAWLEISVADSGNGMNPDDIARFQLPFEALSADGRQLRGIGLGLPLAYQIIRAHGGDLRFETETGTGSRAVIRLPVAPPPVEGASAPAKG
jgi:two-component system cell cycle sensor histidine kinase PleC